jgi:hypothetical protein
VLNFPPLKSLYLLLILTVSGEENYEAYEEFSEEEHVASIFQAEDKPSNKPA